MTWNNQIAVVTSGHSDNNSGVSTFTTASCAFSDGVLYLLFYTARGEAASPNVPTINKHTGGASAGFTTITNQNNAGTNMRSGVMRLLPAAGAGFTDTLDIVTSVNCWTVGWAVIAIPLIKPTGTNGADAISESNAAAFTSATSQSISLTGSLDKTSNIIIGWYKQDTTVAVTPTETGLVDFTLSATTSPSRVHRFVITYKSPGGTSLTWSTSPSSGGNGSDGIVEINTLDAAVAALNTVA